MVFLCQFLSTETITETVFVKNTSWLFAGHVDVNYASFNTNDVTVCCQNMLTFKFII